MGEKEYFNENGTFKWKGSFLLNNWTVDNKNGTFSEKGHYILEKSTI